MPHNSHTSTTLKRAKASFKKNGPRLPEHEARKYERGAILDRRAEELKEREQKRKRAREKREQKEMRDQEGKRKIGLGLATQLVGFSHSQKRMKGAMEGFLGVGRKKKNEDNGKENEIVTEECREKENEDMKDELEEDMFDDDMFLDELEMVQPAALPGQLADPEMDNQDIIKPDLEDVARSADNGVALFGGPTTFMRTDNNKHKSGIATSSKISPSRPPIPVESVSPSDQWADMFATSTQICREISQPKTPSKPIICPGQSCTENLEPRSDDLFDSTKKTSNPPLDATDGVATVDFAYFRKVGSQDFILEHREVLKPAGSFGSLKRKRGYKFPNVIATPSPKMTSNFSSFTAAQCSFTSKYEEFGLSTQILNEAIEEDTEPDTDEEDFGFQDQTASKVAASAPVDRDRALMPPPPLRNSPKIFKPPSGGDLFEGNGGLHILGLSTQILREAILLGDEGSDTEEDEASPSLPSPPLLPAMKFPFTERSEIVRTKRLLSPSLEASPYVIPKAKRPRLVSSPQSAHPRHLQNSVASKSISKPRSFNRSFSAPQLVAPPPPMYDLHEFGFSTQILNAFASENFELSPDDNKKQKPQDYDDRAQPFLVGEEQQVAGEELKVASSSFGLNEDLEAGFWDEAALERNEEIVRMERRD